MKRSLALAVACAPLLFSSPAEAQEAKPKDDRECLAVELMMYSGRPRPRYLICEEEDMKRTLELLAEADEEKPADMEVPEMPSDPSYQGILLTLPAKGGIHSFPALSPQGFREARGR